MTRRLALAILLTVWATLLVAGAGSYLIVRSVLVADLDRVLFARAAALPELARHEDAPSTTPQYDWTDVYVIRDETGRSVPSMPDTGGTTGFAVRPPSLIGARNTRSPDGRRLRTITVAATARAAEQSSVPVRVTYSGSLEPIDAALWRIAGWLMGSGLAAGLLAAGASVWLSRVALRPLLNTANLVGQVNEQRLHSRISVETLPEEIQPVAKRLNDMLARLEYAFAQRKRFVADASHELRAPVEALTTCLEIALRQPRDADSDRQRFEQCLRDAQLLRRLIERLMEHVRVESASLSAGAGPAEPTDVSALLSHCVDAAEDMGSAKQIRIVRSFPSQQVCDISPDRLRSVVQNLLSNAIDHNRAGGRIELTSFHDGQRLHVAVRDDGVGIAAEQIPRLFEPFYRGDAARAAQSTHLGLGLFLVQSHLNAMGGSCRVESRVNAGSTFHVEIPCVAFAPGHRSATLLSGQSRGSEAMA